MSFTLLPPPSGGGWFSWLAPATGVAVVVVSARPVALVVAVLVFARLVVVGLGLSGLPLGYSGLVLVPPFASSFPFLWSCHRSSSLVHTGSHWSPTDQPPPWGAGVAGGH